MAAQDVYAVLSPAARAVLALNPHAYQALVVIDAAPPPELAILSPENVLIKPSDQANAILAGLWLWHDGLEASHQLSQRNDTPTGSFWHAIMHRREGDFANSKYWYARCADHPVLPILAAQASPLLDPLPADKSLLKLTARGWNPAAFVDLVASVYQSPDDPRYELCVALQRLEWRLLFEHCLRLVQ